MDRDRGVGRDRRWPSRAAVVLQLAYAVACMAAAVPLILALGPVAAATNQTSVRVLGCALLALGFGAAWAARDPFRHRAVIGIEIVFTAATALALVYRLAADENVRDRAWLMLPLLAICVVLLVISYPRS